MYVCVGLEVCGHVCCGTSCRCSRRWRGRPGTTRVIRGSRVVEVSRVVKISRAARVGKVVRVSRAVRSTKGSKQACKSFGGS